MQSNALYRRPDLRRAGARGELCDPRRGVHVPHAVTTSPRHHRRAGYRRRCRAAGAPSACRVPIVGSPPGGADGRWHYQAVADQHPMHGDPGRDRAGTVAAAQLEDEPAGTPPRMRATHFASRALPPRATSAPGTSEAGWTDPPTRPNPHRHTNAAIGGLLDETRRTARPPRSPESPASTSRTARYRCSVTVG